MNVDAPLLQPRYVHVSGGKTLPYVELLVQYAIGEIVVAIPDEGITMECSDPLIAYRAVCEYAYQHQNEARGDAAVFPVFHQILSRFMW